MKTRLGNGGRASSKEKRWTCNYDVALDVMLSQSDLSADTRVIESKYTQVTYLLQEA